MAQERTEPPPEALSAAPARGRSRAPAAVAAWWNRTFDSMSNRNLRILWIGTFLNFAGVTMNGTAQGVVAFDLTGSNKAVGAVMLGQGLSLFIISPFAGALADRFSKRTMLVVSQLILGSTFGFIGFAIATGIVNIPMLAVSSFITGTMFAVIRPVRNAYIGELATPDQRGNAVAVQQLAMSAMQIIGPFMAGLLLGWSLVGSSGTYFVMAIAFVFAILTMFQLPATKSRAKAPGGPTILQETRAGFTYSWTNPEIRWVLAGFVMLTLVGTPYMTLLPGYVSEVLGMSTARLGVLLGISALGGFIVSLGTASLADSTRAPMIMLACNLLFGASLIGLGVAPSFGAAAVVIFFLGAGASGFQMLNTAIALRAADLAYMGRVASLTMMAMSLSGIIAFPVGAMADAWGERFVLTGMGFAVFTVAVVLAIWKQVMLRSARAGAATG